MTRQSNDGNGHPAAHPPEVGPDAVREPAPEFPPEEDRGNLPVHVVRFGLVRACVWQVQTTAGTRHNVTVSRLYRGGDDAWHVSTVFSYRDLLALAKALDWAHTWISGQIASDSLTPP